MNQRLDFIASLGLSLSAAQLNALLAYADLVWEKKETLNLTSVRDKQEIWDRHILDGLAAASIIAKHGSGPCAVADYGAGAGYIGISIAAALPSAQVSLIESIEKRCMFMEWIIFKLGLKNVKVLNIRAGDRGRSASPNYDFITERAMGQLDDILPACARDLKPGGLFIAYQAAEGSYKKEAAQKSGVSEENVFNYILPGENKQRKLVLFKKWIQQ